MRGRSDRPRLIDRAARGAAAGMSRRELMRLAAGAAGVAVAGSLPNAGWPTVARAQAPVSGTCPPQRKGTCPSGWKEGPWRRDAEQLIPSGTRATYNGCGAEGSIDFVPDYPSLAGFWYGCREHDCCYATCGADKNSCDDAFLADSLRACREAHGGDGLLAAAQLLTCNQAAAFYAWGVSGKIGDGAYEAAQRDACRSCDPCRRPCGEECCPPEKVCRDGACRDPLQCPSGTSECDGYCCRDGLCIDGRCTRLCDGSPCPVGQDCCFRAGGDPHARGVCCAAGTTCYYTHGGVGKCIPL